MLTSLGVARAGANDSEPLYYIYQGKQKALTLDVQHLAVHVKTTPPDELPASLTGRGLTTADIESRLLTDWIVVRSEKLFSGTRTNSIPGATNTVHTDAARLHSVIRSLGSSGDPAIDFISPVFRDARGNPVLLTSRLLIGFNKDFSPSDRSRLQTMIQQGAFTETSPFPKRDQERWQIRTADGFAVLAAANTLAQTPGVTYAEPDMIASGYEALIPTDPYFVQSWALRNTGQAGGLVGFDLDATAAWDITLGDPSILVMILDSGVQQDHPDINQITGRDFTTNAQLNPTGGPVSAFDNHGTLVAGCVSGKINNGIGTAGIAPNSRIVSARVHTPTDGTGHFTFQFSWVIDALNWGESIAVRITNNSNGYSEPSSALDAAYAETRSAGMVHFAAAGNATGTLAYPACIPDVNAVGSVDRHGNNSSFSNTGYGLKFMAPGEEILTTDRTGKAGLIVGDYFTVSGTSFASPYAAGVAALILSQHPSMTPDQVVKRMEQTCRPVEGFTGYTQAFGYGMLDAYQALVAPDATPTPSPTPTPLPNPQALKPDNILLVLGPSVGGGPVPDQNVVEEITDDGVIIQSIPFNYGGGPYLFNFDALNRVVVDENGFIDAFNGSFFPLLTRYAPADGTMSDLSFSNWVSQGSGGIGAYKNFIFVTDIHSIAGPGNAIIRFDTDTNDGTRFPIDTPMNDLTIGLDGKLYVLAGLNLVNVYDPLTLTLLRSVTLSQEVTGPTAVAVDQGGRLFLCFYSTVARLTPDGLVDAKREVGGANNDIAVDQDGRVALTTHGSYPIMLGDTSLGSVFTPIQVPNLSGAEGRYLWVTFAQPVPSTAPTPIPTPSFPAPHPVDPNNILVGIANSVQPVPPFGANTVREFTPDGTLVQTIQFQYGNGGYRSLSPLGPEYLRRIVVDQSGSIDAYNGDRAPFITRLDPATNTFTHYSFPGFSGYTASGSIAAYGNFLFVTDDDGANPYFPRTAHGIIRLNTSTGQWVRFAADKYFNDLNMGADGKLYTLVSCEGVYCAGKTIEIYDPVSLALARSVPLPVNDFLASGASAVAADKNGRIFVLPASYSFLFRLTPDGAVDAMKPLPLFFTFDIHVDESGQVLLGAQNTILMCDADLEKDFVSFKATDDGDSNGVVSINFARPVPASTPIATPTPTPTPTPIGTPGPPPTITVFASPGSVQEGGTAQFIISASPVNPAHPTSVNFSLTGRAALGLDYTVDGSPAQVTIPAGASSANVTIHALTDSTRERSEGVTLTLVPSQGYNLPRRAGKKATITILNVGGSRR